MKYHTKHIFVSACFIITHTLSYQEKIVEGTQTHHFYVDESQTDQLSSEDQQCKNAYIQLGKSLAKQGQHKDALEYYKKALLLDIHDAELYFLIGNSLCLLNYFDIALDSYYKAYTIDPNHLGNIIELANTLNLLNKPQEALVLYLKVLEHKPQSPKLLYNIGYTLKKMNIFDKALSMYQKALELQPDYSLAHYSLGVLYLTIGDFYNGWQAYQWRSKIANEDVPDFTQPIWNGSDLNNKKILVYTGNDIAETILFLRYTRLLKEQGAHIIMLVPQEHQEIIATCPFIDQIFSDKNEIPQFDIQIPLRGLPLVYKTNMESIPDGVPYLNTSQENTSNTIQQGTFTIGMYFSTQRNQKSSITIRDFIPLARHNIQLISLQTIQFTDEIQEKYRIHIHEVNDIIPESSPQQPVLYFYNDSESNDIQLLNILKQCNLIICNDSKVAHVSGALGIPTWVLIDNQSHWVWGLDRLHTAWYPTIRLFRNEEYNNWQKSIHTITYELIALINKHNTQYNHTLPVADLIDQFTYYQACATQTSIPEIKNAATYIQQALLVPYRTSIESNNTLNSYAHQLAQLNKYLHQYTQELNTTPYTYPHAHHIDLMRKIVHAYNLKCAIKEKITSITHNSKGDL